MKLIKASEVSKILCVSKDYVYGLVRKGEIPCIFIANKILFDENDIVNFINSKKTKSASNNDLQKTKKKNKTNIKHSDKEFIAELNNLIQINQENLCKTNYNLTEIN